jgi:predicted ATPase/DNA-binding winged helix-turn-helix (wHTH) protein
MSQDDRARTNDALSFGPFSLFARERRLERDGQPIKVGSRALDVLISLTERAGEILSKEDLIARVWPETAVEESGLRVHIAALRKALGDGVDGARYIRNVPGRGYAFVGAVTRPSASASLLVPSTIDRRRPLPSQLERIIGRGEATREIAQQLLAKRFVSVVGAGGMGKTTVAVAIAHALLPEFLGNVSFVDLGALTDPQEVPTSVASALGLDMSGDDVGAGLVAFLRDRRILLVLDSCEHVVSVAAPLTERLVGEAAGVHLLTTSRESLRVEGEHVYRLQPLESPPGHDGVTAAEALNFTAVQLFVERATARGARLTLLDDDAPVVAGICRRLDGIALAIEFAAGRVDAYGVRGTASLLENRFKLLWQGRRTALPRHRTLSALLDWSYDLLGDPERRTLRRLSTFVGYFSLDGVAEVAGDVDLGGEQAIEAIGSLVDKSLVSVDTGSPTGARYRLLDTTRAYAQTKLGDANEHDAVARRHATYVCSMLDRDRGLVDRAYAQSLAEQLGNVRAALTWCFSDAGDAVLGTRLAAAAAPVFMDSSLLHECQRWMETALASLDDADRGTRKEMNLRAALGVAAMFTRGNGPEIRTALVRGLELADAVEEPHEQLRLLGALNILLTRTGDWRDSLAVAERSEQIATKLTDDPAAQSFAAWMVGTSRHLLGDQVEAEARCRTALSPSPISRSTAMLYFGFDHRVRGLVVLGRALWLLGRADDAGRVAEQTAREASKIGQPTTVAISLVWTSSVFLWSGAHDVAGSIIEKLVTHAAKHSLGPYQAVGLGLRGELLVKRGDAAGVDVLRRATEALHAGRHRLLETVFMSALAEGLALCDQFSEALSAIELALSATARNGGASFDLPEMLRIKGHLLSTKPEPDLAAARLSLEDALESAKRQGALGWELRAATTMARFLAEQGREQEGRELLATTYDKFTQGFQTADLRAAKRLLSER